MITTLEKFDSGKARKMVENWDIYKKFFQLKTFHIFMPFVKRRQLTKHIQYICILSSDEFDHNIIHIYSSISLFYCCKCFELSMFWKRTSEIYCLCMQYKSPDTICRFFHTIFQSQKIIHNTKKIVALKHKTPFCENFIPISVWIEFLLRTIRLAFFYVHSRILRNTQQKRVSKLIAKATIKKQNCMRFGCNKKKVEH